MNLGLFVVFISQLILLSEAINVRLTSGWLGSQFGGKAEEVTLGTRAVMMRSRTSTAILIVVGGNMLETDWRVEQGWESERS